MVCQMILVVSQCRPRVFHSEGTLEVRLTATVGQHFAVRSLLTSALASRSDRSAAPTRCPRRRRNPQVLCPPWTGQTQEAPPPPIRIPFLEVLRPPACVPSPRVPRPNASPARTHDPASESVREGSLERTSSPRFSRLPHVKQGFLHAAGPLSEEQARLGAPSHQGKRRRARDLPQGLLRGPWRRSGNPDATVALRLCRGPRWLWPGPLRPGRSPR